jgi:hypothetical protein
MLSIEKCYKAKLAKACCREKGVFTHFCFVTPFSQLISLSDTLLSLTTKKGVFTVPK